MELAQAFFAGLGIFGLFQGYVIDHLPQLQRQVEEAKCGASFLELLQKVEYRTSTGWQLLATQEVAPDHAQYSLRSLDAVGLIIVSQ
jgi:hypothetical protein